MRADYSAILNAMPSISLQDMSAVRLMNRIDRKYLATEQQLLELLGLLNDEYMVQEVGNRRFAEYHTIYLDDNSHIMYCNHHNGRLNRQKVRVRTYMDTGDTFFEVKLKNNHGRTNKQRIHIDSQEETFSGETATFLSKKSRLPIPLSDMNRCVENRFERITLVNKAKTERLTIDTGLEFHNLETDLRRPMPGLVVIEVKRAGNTCSPIQDILRTLGIRPCGFSKYCIGSALTNPDLKRNRFNVKIRKIDKMLNAKT